jgi:hypothetical protein
MPTSTYIPLQTITLGSAASSVTFASIPQTYRDLVLVYNGNSSGSRADTLINFNGDTTSGNYSAIEMQGNGSTPFSSTYLSAGTIDNVSKDIFTIQVMDYSATDKHKSSLVRSSNSGSLVRASAYRWADNSAVTSLTFKTQARDFTSGSTFSLYAIEA